MTEIITVDRLDWQEFAAEYWDRRPVLVRGVDPAPFVVDEVFASAVAAGVAEYDGNRAPSAQFTVHRTQRRDLENLLPQATDGSFDGYEERIEAELDGERYALIVSGFHGFDRPLWQREREFFAGLWAQVGLPLTGAITTLFHGNYDHSPVGVHKDRFATFMFGLRERKRMRFWSERPWDEPLSSLVDYRRHVPTSFAVEVEPGDFLYWPAGYYHVGETSSDRTATSVNVGVPRTEHRAEYDVEDLLADLDPRLLMAPGARLAQLSTGVEGPARVPVDGTHLTTDLPPAYQQALDVVRALSLDDRLTEVSTRRWFVGGFEPPPPGVTD